MVSMGYQQHKGLQVQPWDSCSAEAHDYQYISDDIFRYQVSIPIHLGTVVLHSMALSIGI